MITFLPRNIWCESKLMNIKKNIIKSNIAKKYLKLINQSSLLLIPLSLLSITALETLASEAREITAPLSVGNANLLEETENLDKTDGMSQIINVNQMRDVSPTDWAYEALRSLVDRYSCIAGFPNQTYRGSQAISRYE